MQVIRKKTEARLNQIAEGSRGALGFFAQDLTSGEHFALNENLPFPQASAIKIPILMEVFKQAAEGRFQLSDARRIEKRDQVGGTGLLAQLGVDNVATDNATESVFGFKPIKLREGIGFVNDMTVGKLVNRSLGRVEYR